MTTISCNFFTLLLNFKKVENQTCCLKSEKGWMSLNRARFVEFWSVTMKCVTKFNIPQSTCYDSGIRGKTARGSVTADKMEVACKSARSFLQETAGIYAEENLCHEYAESQRGGHSANFGNRTACPYAHSVRTPFTYPW